MRRYYVYFLELHENGPIKIGRSGNVGVRLGQLRRQYGDEVALLGVADAGPQTEHNLHVAFRADRIEGEWFMRTPRLLDVIAHAEANHRLPLYEIVNDLPLPAVEDV